MIEKLFHLRENNTTVKTEVLAGLTTFSTMAYIIFVNPVVLGTAGMDRGAVMVATILAASLATLIMGLYANYPFALAPGMGLNAYFAYGVVLSLGHSWQAALGASFLAGVVFLILNIIGLRRLIMESIAPCLRIAVTAGIGLFLSLIGLKNIGVVVPHETTIVALGDVTAAPVYMAGLGLVIISVLMTLQVRGAILIGILVNWGVGLLAGLVEWHGVVSMPPSIAPTLLQLDVAAALKPDMINVVIAFLFIAIFDAAGTLVSLAEQGGFLDKRGKMPRVNKALTADAIGTMTGAVAGTSPVTTFLESASGIGVGGKTGLTAVVVAVLFLCSLFFSPLATSIPLFATAPVLIIIGALMLRSVCRLNWDDPSEFIPAFIILITIPLTFSIGTGIGLGFIIHPTLKLLCGRPKEVHPLGWVLAVLFIAKFAWL